MKLNVKKTNTGRGVFAGEEIKKGSIVTTMTGKEYVWDKVEGLIKAGKVRLDDPFQIEEDDFLLLDPLPLLFNHSCEPNIGITKKEHLLRYGTFCQARKFVTTTLPQSARTVRG